MVYLTKHCFNKGGRRQGQKDPFKYQFVSTVERINGKINRPTLISAFEEISHVQVYDNEDNISLQDLLIEEENIADIKVVIASFTDIEFPLSITVNDCTFELQTIIDIEHITDIKWDGTIHSKHYGTQFQSYWSQKKEMIPIPFKSEIFQMYSLSIGISSLLLMSRRLIQKLSNYGMIF